MHVSANAARPPKPILILGPTASGKSALAMAVAARLPDSLILNADALQVYAGWRALTARPNEADTRLAEHALYGHIDPSETGYSAGQWLREVTPLLADARQHARATIIVGGTGLYFKVLTEGLAPIPQVPASVRDRIVAEIEAGGLAAAADQLRRRDPDSAARVDLLNPRRVQRALEVLEATGKGLAAWAAETPPPLLPVEQAVTTRLTVERAALRARIARRLSAMVEDGALDEVAAMVERAHNWSLPSMQALGARALAEHLAGRLTLPEALEQAALETGRYAKRQDTWARNQCGHWRAFDWGAAPGEQVEATAQELAQAALE